MMMPAFGKQVLRRESIPMARLAAVCNQFSFGLVEQR